MAKITTIIFDFGGILLDLDYKATYDSFSKLLGKNITKENAIEEMGTYLYEIEKGSISEESFLWKIQKNKNGDLDPIDIVKSFNAMLLGIRSPIFPFLKSIKANYKTILLSNTNSIHIRYALKNIIEKEHSITDWGNYFDSVYYSHEMGMRKPDHEIYKEVMKLESIKGSEILFVDDTSENVTAAMECGWNAIQHDPKEKIELKIKEYIEACESI